MPAVSDPGQYLIVRCMDEGIPVVVIPGPSAVVAALVASGLPAERWSSRGSFPARHGLAAERLALLAPERRTSVLFESPRRVGATLHELAKAFGPGRRAAVCRELTKLHEEVRRGTLAELSEAFGGEGVEVAARSPSWWRAHPSHAGPGGRCAPGRGGSRAGRREA